MHKEILENYDISVDCYNLRTNFQCNKFEGSARLLTIADKLRETYTDCLWGIIARFNARVSNGHVVSDRVQVQMGGNESFSALCRRYFKQWKLYPD